MPTPMPLSAELARQLELETSPVTPRQNKGDQLPPPPALAPREVAPAGYAPLDEPGTEDLPRIEPAIYR